MDAPCRRLRQFLFTLAQCQFSGQFACKSKTDHSRYNSPSQECEIRRYSIDKKRCTLCFIQNWITKPSSESNPTATLRTWVFQPCHYRLLWPSHGTSCRIVSNIATLECHRGN